jgi:trehalose 6-phosphate phosphatase
MRNILAGANRDVLGQFAWSNVLLAFDYDGTLAPIVADPERATMRATTRRLLAELAKLYPCTVISGRAQADAARWLRGIQVCEVVGNHGVEPWHATRRFRQEVERWQPLLKKRLSAFRGVVIEDKVFSVAVHYRRSREKKRARVAILDSAAALGDVRVIGGKQVVNILPNGAPHKGIALETERDRLQCDTAIYVGDDETDEDVFGLDQPGRLLSIRVGAKRASLASFCLKDQAAIDELLRTLIAMRRQSAQHKAALG